MQLSFVGPKVGVNLLFIHDLNVEPTQRLDDDCFKVRIILPSQFLSQIIVLDSPPAHAN